jgi:hypothetical protein
MRIPDTPIPVDSLDIFLLSLLREWEPFVSIRQVRFTAKVQNTRLIFRIDPFTTTFHQHLFLVIMSTVSPSTLFSKVPTLSAPVTSLNVPTRIIDPFLITFFPRPPKFDTLESYQLGQSSLVKGNAGNIVKVSLRSHERRFECLEGRDQRRSL